MGEEKVSTVIGFWMAVAVQQQFKVSAIKTSSVANRKLFMDGNTLWSSGCIELYSHLYTAGSR